MEDSVVSHPEPDILECEVRWALRSTAVNKTSGCDEIPAELFKYLKRWWWWCHQGFVFIMSACLEDPAVATELEKVNLIPIPRKSLPKNELIIGSSHSSPIPVRSCLKSCKLGFSIIWTKNFQMSKLGLEKEEVLEIKLPTSSGLYRKQGNFRKKNIYLCSIDYTKAFDCLEHDKLESS